MQTSLSHTDQTKAYVARKKIEMGKDEYLKMMAAKKREYRARLKNEPVPKLADVEKSNVNENTSIPSTQLKTLFEKMITKRGQPLRPLTIKGYVDKFNRVCTLATGCKFTGDITFLNDRENIKRVLKDNSSAENHKDFITPIVRVLRELKADDKLIEGYVSDMGLFKDDEYAKRAQNSSSLEDTQNRFDINEASKKIIDFKPKSGSEEMYKVLLGLYICGDKDTFVARNDWNIFRLVASSKKIRDLNKIYNYLQVKNGLPVGIVMCNYKSASTYGVVKFPLSKEQIDILTPFISKKQNGDLLFTIDNREPTKVDMAVIIQRAGLSILGLQNLTIDRIRRQIATDFWKDGLHSLSDEERNARRFLHSSKMNREYVRRALVDE